MKKLGENLFGDDLFVEVYEFSASIGKTFEPVVTLRSEVDAVHVEYVVDDGFGNAAKWKVLLPIGVLLAINKSFLEHGLPITEEALSNIQQAQASDDDQVVIDALDKYTTKYEDRMGYSIYYAVAKDETTYVFIYSKQYLLTNISFDNSVFDKMLSVVNAGATENNTEAGDKEIPAGALDWCRKNAPEALANCSDDELWDYMQDAYFKFEQGAD